MAISPSLLYAIATTVLGLCNAQAIDVANMDSSRDTPSSVGDFDYVGCLGLTPNQLHATEGDDTAPLFQQVEEWPYMSIDQCISNCEHSAYAAVSDQKCYCSHPEVVELPTTSLISDKECDIPCPGNPSQTYGGLSNSPNHLPPPSIVLSLYRNTAFYPDTHLELLRARAIVPPMTHPTIPADPIVIPTAISTSYTILCTPPVCASAYLSATATTITALMTRSSPEVVPTVSMTTTTVSIRGSLIGDGDAEVKRSDDVEEIVEVLRVPDEQGIKEIHSDVRAWRNQWEASREHNDDAMGVAIQGLNGVDVVDAVAVDQRSYTGLKEKNTSDVGGTGDDKQDEEEENDDDDDDADTQIKHTAENHPDNEPGQNNEWLEWETIQTSNQPINPALPSSEHIPGQAKSSDEKPDHKAHNNNPEAEAQVVDTEANATEADEIIDTDPVDSERRIDQARGNHHKGSFMGIGGLENVQVMHASGHWEKKM